ncbi:hypothetical protein SLEP1_g42400 [Rubroshorea leprosula]|uniref:Uncharacterized protein n=1 Tax=Rubroshorea leprosula TaxID=152421 RepID=A0AAV5LAL3_9ROSI|nr:hypothetical protein SLEP1_g42400 [Rubroshorea leprosula]
MPGFGGTQHAWVPCEPRRWVRKEPEHAGFARNLSMLGSQGTRACRVRVWVRKEPEHAGFASGFASGFARNPSMPGSRLGSHRTQHAWVWWNPAHLGSLRTQASGFTPNPACLGLVEPSTLGFGSLRTQGTQACWVRVWVPTNPAL